MELTYNVALFQVYSRVVPLHICVCVPSLSSEKNRMTLDLLKTSKDTMGRSHIPHTKFSY